MTPISISEVNARPRQVTLFRLTRRQIEYGVVADQVQHFRILCKIRPKLLISSIVLFAVLTLFVLMTIMTRSCGLYSLDRAALDHFRCGTNQEVYFTSFPSITRASFENKNHSILWKKKTFRRRLSQCLIIGVRKGGTRALLEFLGLHPKIQAEKQQEVHFFDDDRNYARGIDWYRKRMRYSSSDQETIEKTPAYFLAEKAPDRVFRMNPGIKLLVAVRDPIDRALSDYMQIHSSQLQRGHYHPPFEELALNHTSGEVNCFYKPIRRSLYSVQLDRWLARFDLRQFHFVKSESLVRQPVEELRKIENFLGIEHRLNDELFYFNKTRGFYCMRPESHREKCLSSSKGRVHPTLDANTDRKLRKFFEPYNEKFYEMVGIDFGWGRPGSNPQLNLST